MEIIILRKQIGVIAGYLIAASSVLRRFHYRTYLFVFLLSYMTRSQMILQGHSPIFVSFSVHTLSDITLASEENKIKHMFCIMH